MDWNLKSSSRGRLGLAALLSSVGLFACGPSGEVGGREAAVTDVVIQASFDGAEYAAEAEMTAHGERVAMVLGCNSCHMSDYSGANFGELIPLVEGLWATNISLTLPDLSDEELDRLLREGVHPAREIYLMPSKQSQFLSAPDMDALIAFLRTVEAAGDPTPVPPPGFEAAVTARLPEDYWRTMLDGQPRSYHNAAEEVEYFAENAAPDFGVEHAQGRLVALTVCSLCHGAALDGLGEPAGNIQGALDYDDASFERLLRDGVDQAGRPIEMIWETDHVPPVLTDSELDAVIAYTRHLARRRSQGNR